ncbi:DNA adenine methylase [Pseudoduganella namucuonensis]|uniref:D12 class N6 adenine-specific DNA methyltransferase n=1 Tax=Pseudoduganella namucuonensis TaxID=1035707 RepID=A0A1I7KQ31_9BURK|nr:DNA adenine methylase [Pseudoduganella namucuonensis]SFU99553.1 D12 class N6 adenine-specific DNA methyltransferase [Pseudoduganella namucuonensis]
MKYPGGKGGAGVYQTIINLIPPHRVYIEAFAGGANIYFRKAPAASSILVERDFDQARTLFEAIAGRDEHAGTTTLNVDAVPWLSSYPWVGDEFVYLDPPYVLSTRTKKAIYAHEMSDEDHRDLISALVAMSNRGVRFMLSGYRNAIYDEAARAAGWRRVDFQAMTRGGVRTESVWMNYEAPAALADYGYAGSNFRERERIKRKVHRWVQRLQQLPALERAALLSAMQALEAAAAGKNGDGRPRSSIAESCEAAR